MVAFAAALFSLRRGAPMGGTDPGCLSGARAGKNPGPFEGDSSVVSRHPVPRFFLGLVVGSISAAKSLKGKKGSF